MTTNTEPKLMDGSSTSKSYLLIARRGKIALGIKILGILPSPTRSKHSYVAFRVRSSAYGQDVEHEDTEQKVISLADENLNFESAWPNIKFDKVDASRASTVVGFFVRGSLGSDKLAVFEQLIDGEHIKQLVDFVCDNAGPDHMVLRRGAIVEWMSQHLLKGYEKLKEAMVKKAEFEATVEAQIGVAGFEAQQIKMLLSQHEEEQAAVIKKAAGASAPAEDGAGMEYAETEEEDGGENEQE